MTEHYDDNNIEIMYSAATIDFICPKCKTKNFIEEFVNPMMCGGCDLVFEYVIYMIIKEQ